MSYPHKCPMCATPLKGWSNSWETTWLVTIGGISAAILVISTMMSMVAGYTGKCATRISVGCFIGEELKKGGL